MKSDIPIEYDEDMIEHYEMALDCGLRVMRIIDRWKVGIIARWKVDS